MGTTHAVWISFRNLEDIPWKTKKMNKKFQYKVVLLIFERSFDVRLLIGFIFYFIKIKEEFFLVS